MERLTERYEGRVIPRVDRPKIDCAKCLERLAEYEDIGCTPEQLKQIDKWYAEMCRELGEYKRLEEQGLILRLPCKVGDTVYEIIDGEIYRENVTGFSIGTPHDALYSEDYEEFENELIMHVSGAIFQGATPISEIGKTVFLTKEEAEQALADRRVRG